MLALWLGHEAIETTQPYVYAHLAPKQVVLTQPIRPAIRAGTTAVVQFARLPILPALWRVEGGVVAGFLGLDELF
jgi:hypothetical protein